MKANPIAGYMVKTPRGMLIARSLALTEGLSIAVYRGRRIEGFWERSVKQGYRCVPVIVEERE